MKGLHYLLLLVITVPWYACIEFTQKSEPVSASDTLSTTDTLNSYRLVTDSITPPPVSDNLRNADTALLPPTQKINTGAVQPQELMAFAETLVGTPYVYASTNPARGFDCSGFITYVFNHFKIAVPRSSVDFTPVGQTVPVEQAKRGDIILFTGTNPAERHVGHMGLVVSNTDTLRFIHSSSGKAMGVTVTPLNGYYQNRFVRISRIFPQNN